MKNVTTFMILWRSLEHLTEKQLLDSLITNGTKWIIMLWMMQEGELFCYNLTFMKKWFQLVTTIWFTVIELMDHCLEIQIVILELKMNAIWRKNQIAIFQTCTTKKGQTNTPETMKALEFFQDPLHAMSNMKIMKCFRCTTNDSWILFKWNWTFSR